MAESAKHRRAFDAYWELGAERSLARLHQALEAAGSAPTLRTLEEWSSRFQWQDRIGRLERDAREAADEARITAVREMQERQAREALLLQQKGAQWLGALEPGDVSAEAAIRAVIEGARLERLSRGEVSERVDLGGPDPALGRFTDDELERLSTLLAGDLAGAEPPAP